MSKRGIGCEYDGLQGFGGRTHLVVQAATGEIGCYVFSGTGEVFSGTGEWVAALAPGQSASS